MAEKKQFNWTLRRRGGYVGQGRKGLRVKIRRPFCVLEGSNDAEIVPIVPIGEVTIAENKNMCDFKITKGEYCRAKKNGREP